MRLVVIAAAFVLLCGFTEMKDVQDLVRADKVEEAFQLSQEWAATGDAEAHEALAWFHEEGKGTPKDLSKAAWHFRRAAEAGHKHSQWKLGKMLDLGEGVAADPDEAFQWLSRSAAQGYRHAWTSLGVMHAMGRGTPVDYAKSRDAYMRAARMHEPHGFFGVGVLHLLGQGVRADPVEAFAWFMVAHFLGDEQAKPAADKAAEHLSEKQVKRAVKRMNAISREFGLNEKLSETVEPTT